MPNTQVAIAIMMCSFVIFLMLRMPISFTLGIRSEERRVGKEC